jgi:hypothetical protein
VSGARQVEKQRSSGGHFWPQFAAASIFRSQAHDCTHEYALLTQPRAL